MKILALFFILALANVSFSQKELNTVKNLNIDNYMGDWHEVAAIPAWFQKKCVSNTTASYKKTKEGISVINTCRQKDGSTKEAFGKARINSKFSDNSKLEVTFLNLFSKWWIWIFSGDYWIIDLAKDYSYSVVGEPQRKYLWILSRNKTMTADLFKKLDFKIQSQGYDTCQVIITQEGQYKGEKLCYFNKKK